MRHLSPDMFFHRLREQNVKPYYFGLGFIQCKINPYTRVHFYDPRVPNMMNEEEIHDHRYDFRSHVLFGTLRNDRYKVRERVDGAWVSALESCSPGHRVDHGDVPVDVELTQIELWTNTSYFMHYYDFHRVHAHRAITYLERSDYKQPLAHVIRRQGEIKTCPFSASLPESDCWDIMYDLCKSWKTHHFS